VHVRLHIDRSIQSRVIVRYLEDEVESLWGPYGVQLVWADARDTDAKAGDFSLDANVEQSALSDWVAVLGRAWIEMETGAQSRPIRVSYTATERILDTRTGGRAAMALVAIARWRARSACARPRDRSRGLAAPYHDASGLMRPVFPTAAPTARPSA
jgi:hypothetical protein